MSRPQSLVTAFLIALLVMASSLQGPSQAAAAPVVTLNFLASDFLEYRAFVAAANTIGQSMGLQVKETYVPFGDMQKKLVLDFTSGVRTWDLVFMNSAWTLSIASSKILTPIDEFLTNTETKELVNLADFVPVAKELAYEGKFYAIPYLSAPWMLGYRKDVFDHPGERETFRARYGYQLGVPRTYKAMLDIAKFFTRKKGETLAGEVLSEDFYGHIIPNRKGFLFQRYQSMLLAFGADLIYNQKTMRPTWDSPESTSMLKYYVELFKTMPPGVENMTGGEVGQFAAQGRVAMIIHPLDLMYAVFENPRSSRVVGRFQYALLPTQVLSRPHAVLVQANGIGIYGLSERKAEAFRLLAATLSSKGIKEEVMKVFPEFPSMRRSVLRDPDVVRARPWLYQAISMFAREKVYTVGFPPLKEWPQLVDIASDSIIAAATGQGTVEQALKDGQSAMVAVFRQAGYIK